MRTEPSYGSVGWNSQQAKDANGNPILDASGRPVETWSQTTQLGDMATQALNNQNQLQAGRSTLANGMYDRIAQENANAPDWNSYQQQGGRVDPTGVQSNFGPGYKTSLGQGPQFQTNIGGGDPYYQKAGDAYYQQATSRLDPQWQQSEDKMRTQLANQGLAAGDTAYDQQMQNFQLGKNDAYGSAGNQATMMAGQEAQRMQGMDVQGAQFGNTWGQQGYQNQAANTQFGNQAIANQAAFGNQAAGQQYNQNMSSSQYDTQLRQQQIAEMMQKQGWSLNQANALLSGQQVAMPQMTGFSNATKADTTNYLGAAQAQNQADIATAQQNGSMMSDIMGAVGGLGSSAMMFSDERLKKNITRLPFSVAPGVPLAQYEMKGGGGKQLGVIAQDVARSNPQAVQRDPSGYLKVDYEQVAPGLPFSLGGRKAKVGRHGR